ncbi:hypothetical protein [Massilia agri]|uniref:Uncharacterized protein n=1 Tax=Massilia agri TaxID=1886785 RepID=A0ABT2AHY6_9BURK|nr:hypothetical protein [Massilia agri]
MKKGSNNQTFDLFGDVQNPSVSTSQSGNQGVVERLNWWVAPERDAMRSDSAWSKVFIHLRAAVHMQALTLPARSASEDSQRKRAGGAPLGIYGENAVTLPKRGYRE